MSAEPACRHIALEPLLSNNLYHTTPQSVNNDERHSSCLEVCGHHWIGPPDGASARSLAAHLSVNSLQLVANIQSCRECHILPHRNRSPPSFPSHPHRRPIRPFRITKATLKPILLRSRFYPSPPTALRLLSRPKREAGTRIYFGLA